MADRYHILRSSIASIEDKLSDIENAILGSPAAALALSDAHALSDLTEQVSLIWKRLDAIASMLSAQNASAPAQTAAAQAAEAAQAAAKAAQEAAQHAANAAQAAKA